MWRALGEYQTFDLKEMWRYDLAVVLVVVELVVMFGDSAVSGGGGGTDVWR